jgi:large subunit ribosomal protein L10
MKKEDKKILVDEIAEKIADSNFYVADVSELTSNETVELRKLCYDNGVVLQVSKNTFIKKALDINNIEDEGLIESLKGPSSLMYSESINAPAKLIKEFRKKHKKPILKAAYVENTVYIGDDNLETLVSLKSKEELIADLVALLGSPIRNLLGALNGGNKIMAVLETLSNKEDKE